VSSADRVLGAKRGAEKGLVQRLKGARGGLLPRQTELMELRVETGVPFDLEEVRQVREQAIRAAEQLKRAGRPVSWEVENEGWLVGQAYLVWSAGTGRGASVHWDAYLEAYVGDFLDFALEVCRLAKVEVTELGLGKRIARAQRARKNRG